MRTQWVIGNWKMNGDLASNAALIKALHSTAGITKMAVCVPFTHLAQLLGRCWRTIDIGARTTADIYNTAQQ